KHTNKSFARWVQRFKFIYYKMIGRKIFENRYPYVTKKKETRTGMPIGLTLFLIYTISLLMAGALAEDNAGDGRSSSTEEIKLRTEYRPPYGFTWAMMMMMILVTAFVLHS
ncbi:hypothetical protein ACJX0J_007979, partial [Zea mays]